MVVGTLQDINMVRRFCATRALQMTKQTKVPSKSSSGCSVFYAVPQKLKTDQQECPGDDVCSVAFSNQLIGSNHDEKLIVGEWNSKYLTK